MNAVVSIQVDISTQIQELCEAFGLAVNDVTNIDIWPGKSRVTVTTLRRDEHNQAFLENGDVATTVHDFKVRTYK